MVQRNLMRWRATLTGVIVLTAVFSITAAAQRMPDDQDRRDAVTAYRTGQQFMAEEKFERAAVEFIKAIGKAPMFTLAHYSLGQAYMNLRRYPEAVKAFEGCIEASRQLYAMAETNRV